MSVWPGRPHAAAAPFPSHVLGITGWSGSGKTVLLGAMTRLLVARGRTVSTVKHAHHAFDIDRPGKDSYRHREAGARQVLVASGRRWALMHELDGPEPSLAELLGLLAPCDLVFVEGYKQDAHPKIEVYRPSLGKPPIWPGRDDIVAVATDAPAAADVAGKAPALLPLNDPPVVLDWALGYLETITAMRTQA